MQKGWKQIPIGVDSFKKLRERNCYFVDKSLFIKKIIETGSEVILFTRPRRFGKTLIFSMLKYFLEIPECRRYSHENDDCADLFTDLKIAGDRDFVRAHQGKYPVINLSFKKVKANGWEKAAYYFQEEIAREYKRHRYVLETDILLDFEKEQYTRIMSQKARLEEYTSAITDLSNYLHSYFGEKVIVLMDEYDTPLHYAKLNGYYDEMLDVIRALMVDGLKGNENIAKAIVTGIMKISQESIFSAFNNPKIATLTNEYCADLFGFTEQEVWDMLAYYGLDNYKETVREWYNGYLFGGETVIYNPWSILSFIDNKDHIPAAFWVNTGDTALIRKCLQLDQVKGKEYVERLYRGEAIAMEVEQNIVYEEALNNVDKALSYLLHAGYLKARRVEGKGDTYNLSIPNREVALIYRNILKNWFALEQKTSNAQENLVSSLLQGKMSDFEIYLQDILLASSSYYDQSPGIVNRSQAGKEKERYENFYHGLILGLMVNIGDDYYLESNREYGLGRPDLVLMPKDKRKKAYILEFKNEFSTSQVTAAEAAQEALRQIETRKYAEGVKAAGVAEVVKIGLGFKGKEVKVAL